MKKRIALLLSTFFLLASSIPVYASQAEETSLSKVQRIFSETFEDIDVSETETNNGKILYLAVGEGEDETEIGKILGTIWYEDWFDYDYIFATIFIDGVPLVTDLFDVSSEDISYHVWFTDDLKLKKEAGQISEEQSQSIVLTDGEYIVGKDINPGLYDTFSEEFSSCIIYDSNGEMKNIVNTYKNLTLSEGDKIKITGTLTFSKTE